MRPRLRRRAPARTPAPVIVLGLLAMALEAHVAADALIPGAPAGERVATEKELIAALIAHDMHAGSLL